VCLHTVLAKISHGLNLSAKFSITKDKIPPFAHLDLFQT
jgi:hypothetical protein